MIIEISKCTELLTDNPNFFSIVHIDTQEEQLYRVGQKLEGNTKNVFVYHCPLTLMISSVCANLTL